MKKVFSTTKRCLNFLLFGLCLSMALFAAPTDFDGDGKNDFTVVRRNSDNSYTWFILQSRDGFRAENFGRTSSGEFGDFPQVGDYDGDGKTDLAVFRYNSAINTPAYWYVLKSSDNALVGVQWGLSNDYLVQGDYDGDGKTDFAIYRGGWWYILQSRDGTYAERFGIFSDLPVWGNDYDGDGKADLAVVRYIPSSPGSPIPTVMYIRLSGDGTWQAWDLGDARVTWVVSGDYDGDGKSDVAVWRGSQWLWVRSSDNRIESVIFGQAPNDSPIPADYDGDGKTDVAVVRQGLQRYYYILQSRDGFKAVQWGISTDSIVTGSSGVRSQGF